MNILTYNITLILRQFIMAHYERGDANVEQRYIPRLKQLVEEMESGVFQAFPKDQQIRRLRALGAEYFGRGEVFGLLAPNYLEPEYEGALEQAIKEYVDNLQL